MSETKSSGLASKLANHAKNVPNTGPTVDMKDILPDSGPVEAPYNPEEASQSGTIKTGAVGFGDGMQHAGNVQGRAKTDMRAPGYYSIHMGRIMLKGRVIDWPIHSPLVPDPDDKDLLAFLDHQVKCKRAELVVAPTKEKDEG